MILCIHRSPLCIARPSSDELQLHFVASPFPSNCCWLALPISSLRLVLPSQAAFAHGLEYCFQHPLAVSLYRPLLAMFRRNSSRLEHRNALRRSKSTGSVGTNQIRSLVSIEPLTAERDAHIAARVSFTKARTEASAKRSSMTIPESTSTFALTRSNSFMNGPDVISRSADCGDTAGENTETGICRQRSVRFTGPTAKKPRDVASRAHGTWTAYSDTSSRTRPDSSAGHVISSRMHDHSYDEFWVANQSLDLASKHDESFFGSESSFNPISHRKLRKSRSMFTHSFMSDHSEGTTNELAHWHSQGTRQAAIGFGKSSLRSPKSMSFLKLQSNRGPSMRNHDSKLSASPSKMSLRDSIRLKSRPSIFFRSKNKRNASLTEIKTSMRNSSNNSMPNPSTVSSAASSLSKANGLRNAARKVSKSVKNRFKGLFARKKKESESDDAANTDSSSIHHSQVSLPEEAALSRVRSFVPSLRSVTSENCLQPSQGSLEMAEETADTDGERSRVTSWTNSSTHTVVSAQEIEWEPQRLSVIEESGNAISAVERWRSSEDEERAYSALAHRLDAMQKEQTRDTFTRDGSSIDTIIRAIPNADSNTQEARFGELTLTQGENRHGSLYYEDNIMTATTNGSLPTLAESQSASGSHVSSPTGHLFRTQSPYRRALRQSMKTQDRPSVKPMNLRYLSSLSALSLPTRRSSPNGSEKDIHLSSAESIYSYISDYEDDEQQLSIEEETLDDDRATTAGSLHSDADGTTVPSDFERMHQREVSTASSVEWKKWLSAKVSKLEDSSPPAQSLADEQIWNPWSYMGHVRENAEIEPTSSPSSSSIEATPERPKPQAAAAATQSIIIDDDGVIMKAPTLTYDENSHPAQVENVKPADQAAGENKPSTRSVSSLCNMKTKDGDGGDGIYTNKHTPPKQQGASPVISSTLGRTKKPYFNSGAASSLKSSPGLSSAVRRQFGTIATGSPRRRSIRGGEDAVGKTVREVASFDDCQFGRGLDAQAMGSKRMVELFLNSRTNRRPSIGQGDESTAFL